MDIAFLVIAVLGVVFGAIAILPPLGIDIRIFGRSKMANEARVEGRRFKRPWLAFAVLAVSVCLSASAFYYFFRPRIEIKTVTEFTGSCAFRAKIAAEIQKNFVQDSYAYRHLPPESTSVEEIQNDENVWSGRVRNYLKLNFPNYVQRFEDAHDDQPIATDHVARVTQIQSDLSLKESFLSDLEAGLTADCSTTPQ